jgi:hypothetical protein
MEDKAGHSMPQLMIDARRALFAVFAHPDDETFRPCGTLARADMGLRVQRMFGVGSICASSLDSSDSRRSQCYTGLTANNVAMDEGLATKLENEGPDRRWRRHLPARANARGNAPVPPGSVQR